MGGEKVHDPLVCQICKQLPRIVMEASCCNAIFCKKCVLKLKDGDTLNECPSCGNKMKTFQHNVPIQKILDNQTFTCKYEALGCTKTLQHKDLEDHQAECEFRILNCPNSCNSTLLAKDLEQHIQKKCTHRKVKCPSAGCPKHMKFSQLQSHLKSICEYVPITCKTCYAELLRKNFDIHEEECPDMKVECPYSKCGCTKTMTRKKLSAHLDRNTKTHLHLVMNTLHRQEEEIHHLKDEIKMLKVSLWDRLQAKGEEWIDSIDQWKVPQWIPRINLMYLWITVFLLLAEYVAIHRWKDGEGNFGRHYLSLLMYSIFMGYFYYFQKSAPCGMIWKCLISLYFFLSWVSLSFVILY